MHIVHHQDNTVQRIGFSFEATQWSGKPVNQEPDQCIGLKQFRVHELPEDLIEYPKEDLLGYLNDDGGLTEHGWTQRRHTTREVGSGPPAATRPQPTAG
ncbi:hypothetical protein ACFC4G_48085 [Streptomyces sp. NPDC056002]|uniref:hypothetical protein n=1 Tax=Streptomyces sp. NPDC056002 TaxID=3345675 RepID=UPI0035DE25CE